MLIRGGEGTDKFYANIPLLDILMDMRSREVKLTLYLTFLFYIAFIVYILSIMKILYIGQIIEFDHDIDFEILLCQSCQYIPTVRSLL